MIPVIEKVLEGAQAVIGVFEHGNTCRAQTLRRLAIDRGRQVGHDRERLGGLVKDLLGNRGVTHLEVLAGEVHDERETCRIGVVEQCLAAPEEDLLEVVAGAPRIERVDRRKSRLQLARPGLARYSGRAGRKVRPALPPRPQGEHAHRPSRGSRTIRLRPHADGSRGVPDVSAISLNECTRIAPWASKTASKTASSPASAPE